MLTYITDDVKEGVWGGEQNDAVFLNICEKRISDVVAVRSSYLFEDGGVAFLKTRSAGGFVVASFLSIPASPENPCIQYIMDHGNYVVYEHEHKYTVENNPAPYKNYKIPSIFLQHTAFYENANAVFCQSAAHARAVKANIPKATVVNLSGNLWATAHLDKLCDLKQNKKEDHVAVYAHVHPFKNTEYNSKFCERKKWPYILLGGLSPDEFMNKLASCRAFVYFPGWLETLNRVAVECRMMGVPVITNELLGAAGEPWFALEGADLIDVMRAKREEIPNKIIGALR
jgi:hypothetical protein